MPRVKKETTEKVTKVAAKKAEGLLVPVYNMTGVESGTLSLPEEVFGAKVNKTLLAQAVRVYTNNQKSHFANTKTRGQVQGSTRKIRTQKGTGGARHGALRAPIFVGGGIALGPKYRKVTLDLPKKMRKAALVAALSSKVSNGNLLGVTGVDTVSGKTKQIQEFVNKLAKNNLLLVTDKTPEKLERAVRNLPKVEAVAFDQLNIMQVLKFQTLMLTKEAAEKLESRVKSLESSKDKKQEKEVKS